ncbi:MAG: hypothetical protein K2X11_12995 [Acetobacteraceae bacterium]|nr:hypothetical protein [Acetobacteraceae bacterium]
MLEHSPLRFDDPLVAFSEGRKSKDAAVAELRLHGYSDLMLALGQRGLPIPCLPPDEVEAMSDIMVRLIHPAEPS